MYLLNLYQFHMDRKRARHSKDMEWTKEREMPNYRSRQQGI